MKKEDQELKGTYQIWHYTTGPFEASSGERSHWMLSGEFENEIDVVNALAVLKDRFPKDRIVATRKVFFTVTEHNQEMEQL